MSSNKILPTLVLSAMLALAPSAAPGQDGGAAGAFTRLGFGARGMGMGNAMTALPFGTVQSYYNPALAAFATDRTAAATFGALSFDRSLNFLSYTQPIKPAGGMSIGLINAGVGKIDGRDNDGIHTEDYSIFENQFYLAFGLRPADQVAIGVAVKLYYSKLFDDVTESTVGFDAGAIYRIAPNLSVGVALQDISTKYTWDTKAIYDVDGRTTADKFPQLRRIGVSFAPDTTRLLFSVEFENSSLGTNTFRAGGEFSFNDYFAIRAGLDRYVVSGETAGAKPTFGFSVRNTIGGFTPALHYAFIVEPYSTQGMHIITLSTAF